MIEVKNVTKKYGNNRGISNLSFKVEKGEILGLLGPNGAGKSTTMNIMTGYKPPSEGKVFIDGIDLQSNPLEAKRKIGYLPEIPPLYPELKVSSYLRFVSDLKGVKPERREAHIKEVMELVKIADVSHRLIKNLSKGYKQRVGLAQALIADPEVIILDEPTVGLDPKQIQEMRQVIKGLGKNHTVILSSHILAEVSAVCEKVVILDKGTIAAVDTPQNLAKALQSTERFLARIKGPRDAILSEIRRLDGVLGVEPAAVGDGEDSFSEYIIENTRAVDVKTPLFYAMAEQRYVIHELRPLDASLEDIFLRITGRESGLEGGMGHACNI